MQRRGRVRWFPLGGTLAAVGLVVALLAPADDRVPPDRAVLARSEVPLWGSTVSRNLVNTLDRNIPTVWSANPGQEQNLLWSTRPGSKTCGAPVIAGGKIYLGTNNQKPRAPAIKGDKGVLMCFEETTGKFLWQLVFDKLPGGRVNDWPEAGIVSCPAVVGDRLYFVNNRCELICASTAGAILWKLDMVSTLGVFPHCLATCSPLVVGDTVFVGTSNGVDQAHLNIPAPEAPSFLAVDRHRGKVLWSSNLPTIARVNNPNVPLQALVNAGQVVMHGQWSSPVYAEPTPGKPQVIFPGGDGWLYSFVPETGELLWKYDGNPKGAAFFLGGKGVRCDFLATPVVHESRLYVGMGQDPEHLKGVGRLWCIDITKVPTNKERDLSPFSPPNVPNPVFDPKDIRNKDSGLVWHYGGEAPPGAKRRLLMNRTLSTCAVANGLVFAADYDGYAYCLDAKTGEKFWEHQMEGDTWSSPYCVDGKVYLGNENGEVLVFAASKEKRLLAKNELPGTPCQVRATPVVANGVLYVVTENPNVLYAIKKP